MVYRIGGSIVLPTALAYRLHMRPRTGLNLATPLEVSAHLGQYSPAVRGPCSPPRYASGGTPFGMNHHEYCGVAVSKATTRWG